LYSNAALNSGVRQLLAAFGVDNIRGTAGRRERFANGRGGRIFGLDVLSATTGFHAVRSAVPISFTFDLRAKWRIKTPV
jgi:hypothetical protein